MADSKDIFNPSARQVLEVLGFIALIVIGTERAINWAKPPPTASARHGELAEQVSVNSQRISNVEARTDRIERKLDAIDAHLGAVQADVSEMRGALQELRGSRLRVQTSTLGGQ